MKYAAGPIRLQISGRGSLVVKVDSWLKCHEFESSATKGPSCRGACCILNLSWLKRPPVGVVWKLGASSEISSVILANRPKLNIFKFRSQ
ncbi:hypothetical protein TNCV_3186381 [Trichonephila clavipes]|nr:hypothetical protein TNCV_3186381 [Trichonephila clavipes]